MAYETTNVPVERSQAQLREVLLNGGAQGFGFDEFRVPGGVGYAEVRFRSEGFVIRMRVRLEDPSAERIHEINRKSHRKAMRAGTPDAREWEAQRVWRVLHWTVKARLIAVEEGLETVQQAFLPYLLDERSDETVYEALERTGGLKQLGQGS